MHSDDEIVAIIATADHPFVGTNEIADELGYSLSGTKKRLHKLRNEGRIAGRQPANDWIWWVPDDAQ